VRRDKFTGAGDFVSSEVIMTILSLLRAESLRVRLGDLFPRPRGNDASLSWSLKAPIFTREVPKWEPNSTEAGEFLGARRLSRDLRPVRGRRPSDHAPHMRAPDRPRLYRAGVDRLL